jgi:predicted nuclease of predicted toxin-antitoxin system
MRILLDNCVPWRLAKHIPGHQVTSVVDLGWADLKNGALLEAMAGRFDVFLTVDKSVPFQQRLADRPFAVVILRAKTNRLSDLLLLVPAMLQALEKVSPGEVQLVPG